MTIIVSNTRNLNIRYDLPELVWEKVPAVYENMDGWLGFGDGNKGNQGIPYWYGFDESETSISASVEPSGHQFYATNINDQMWNTWLSDFKSKASKALGFKVAEIELGEVGYETEWTNYDAAPTRPSSTGQKRAYSTEGTNGPDEKTSSKMTAFVKWGFWIYFGATVAAVLISVYIRFLQ